MITAITSGRSHISRNYSPPIMSDYDVLRCSSAGMMISRIAWSADFPLSLPVAMTEAAAA